MPSDEAQFARWGLVSTARVNRHIVAAATTTAAAPTTTSFEEKIREQEREGSSSPCSSSSSSCAGRVVAVASRSADSASKYAEAFKIPTAFDSYDAMLAAPNIDCVYVSLPNHSHVDVVVKAAQHKKHILCEKPMALTARDVATMFDAAEKNGVMLMEGFMNLHSAVVHRARKLLLEGAIGHVIGMSSNFTYTETRGGFRRTESVADGGGALWDVGCYEIALARFLVGRDPESVHCVQEKVPVVNAEQEQDDDVGDSNSNCNEAHQQPPHHHQKRYVDETSAGTVMFGKQRGGNNSRSSSTSHAIGSSGSGSSSSNTANQQQYLAGAIKYQFFSSFSSPLNMSFSIIGTKGVLKILNPFKPDPQQQEKILLQHDIADPPVVIFARGVGLEESASKHLYQGEIDVVSRAALAAKNNKNGDGCAATATTTKKKNQEHNSDDGDGDGDDLFLLASRKFSIGNAAVLEALHKSAESGNVEKVVTVA